jgi:Ca2+-binding RTX toxin-like protein
LAVENGVTEQATVTIGPAAAPAVSSAVASDSTVTSPPGPTLDLDRSHSSTDATGTTNTLRLSAPDDRPIDPSSGNNHLVGGSGLGLLFAGTGTDGASGGANSDYLSASSGNDTLSGGAGANFMQAGSGPGSTMFDLQMADAAKDIISGFRLGQDHLHVTNPTGVALAGPGVAALIGGATSDAAGNAVLHLSEHHDVTLSGIGVAKLGSGMFG